MLNRIEISPGNVYYLNVYKPIFMNILWRVYKASAIIRLKLSRQKIYPTVKHETQTI